MVCLQAKVTIDLYASNWIYSQSNPILICGPEVRRSLQYYYHSIYVGSVFRENIFDASLEGIVRHH